MMHQAFFVEVILPFATPKPYTYHIPDELRKEVQIGVRVEVQFGTGRNIYAGIAMAITHSAPGYTTKPILSVVDKEPIVTAQQIQFWQWIAGYYMCTLGEVMNAALPTNLKLTGETTVMLNPEHNADFAALDDKEYLVAEALLLQKELTIEQIQKILQQKTVYPIINRLLMYGVLELKEELHQKYKPKTALFVALGGQWSVVGGQSSEISSKQNDETITEINESRQPTTDSLQFLRKAFNATLKSDKQTQTLLAFVQLSKKQNWVKASDLYAAAKVDIAVLRAMEKKEIFVIEEKEISRVNSKGEEISLTTALSATQAQAVADIKTAFETKNTVLLQGITGSGKTRVYVELIQEELKRGGRVLYLLPEIALTSQIITRLKAVFGNDIAVYHSRVNGQERVELWNQVVAGRQIILGARSSLFLPFQNLSLIIVDEEHDSSYKQHDPNPRYNSRDCAVYFAGLFGAKVLLGTATPSVETYYNADIGKYGWVKMTQRFGNATLPEIQIVDTGAENKKRTMLGNFSPQLLSAIKDTIAKKKQVILFQNRRGYAPTLTCSNCTWTFDCRNCDVTLTYHKHLNAMNCHYCGFTAKVPKECPACSSPSLLLKGYGTERIEDELKIHLPDARIARLDLDTARSKINFAKLLDDFEAQELDILVGTQMVTKGLDFEKVALVGVMNADSLLHYPNFRAAERAFQLLTQVSGRAGRKETAGKVLIQSYDTKHLVLRDVLENQTERFYERELKERERFQYPPYYRLISVSVRHKKYEVMAASVKIFTQLLKNGLGTRVSGPAEPLVPRVNTYYITDYLIKVERDAERIILAKKIIADAITQLQHGEGFSTVKIAVNVDVY